MPKPTLTEVFGTGATQTATSITILKADLPTLTPSATNTAESILTGIALKAQLTLTTTARDTNLDQVVAIENGFPQTTFRGSTSYAQSTLSLTLLKLSPAETIDADDY